MRNRKVDMQNVEGEIRNATGLFGPNRNLEFRSSNFEFPFCFSVFIVRLSIGIQVRQT